VISPSISAAPITEVQSATSVPESLYARKLHVKLTEEITESSKWKIFVATAYTARCNGCIGITKTGVDVRKTTEYEGKRVIAVDPKVIPLGSTVELRLSDGEIIEATAQDIGGAIKGERIDILFAKYDDAMEFGRQSVDIRIIDEN